MLGTISEKSPAVEKLLEPQEATAYTNLPISQTTRYQSFSKYPYIVRDIAIWVPNGTEPVEVLEKIKTDVGEMCVKISLFDQFKKPARPDDSGRSGGDSRTSLAFRLVFQSFDRTLTEVEVNAIMQTVATSLFAQGFEVR